MLIKTCLRLLGILFLTYSLTYLPPILIALLFDDKGLYPFINSFLITFALGLLLWLPTRRRHKVLRIRDGFLIVSVIWSSISLLSTLPFLFILPHLPFTDSFFEAMSGITTTGATNLQYLSTLPHSLLFYRQQLQFIGGMGIILLAIAILPTLGIGGLQLFTAENNNFNNYDKLTPHIAQTAKILWSTYTLLTLSCFLLYYLFGMSGFDAICYAFSTVSTGGFAPYDNNFGHYQNNFPLQICALLFMLLSSINFSLHFITLKKKQIRHYFKNSEIKFFALSTFIFFILILYPMYSLTPFFSYKTIFTGLFQVVSLSTSTGFTTTNFSSWPNFVPYVLIIAGLIGGCTGSTSGGLKILRVLVALKTSACELKKLLHPQGIFFIKINQHAIKPQIIISIWGFLSIYAVIFALITCALIATGLDFNTAFSSTIASLANLGPALGKASHNFSQFTSSAKLIMTIAMLIGRLEIFTIIILMFPSFWRQ